MPMRRSLVTLVLLVTSACSFERATSSPQPQKSALSQCYANGCAKPMFVVDGKRLSDDSVDLNPSDILTVEVFKGPLAVAQYGADARNGVVVVTTKRAVLQK
jgi:TonB-dependent SusC/RagA subfamily outer membrane receptor